jgi:serine/threonine-protein kinase RsbW
MRDELRVAATIENLRTISDFVREAGRRLRLTEDGLFDVDLAVEEAAANIVRHAYGPDRAGDIQVVTEILADALRITLTDWGLPFRADPSYLDVNVSLEARAEGGMGVLLIQKLMDSVTRQTASVPGGPNVLTMVKSVER